MTRDRKGQAFVPGFLAAAARTPIMTAGELPGGGGLFAQHTTEAEAEQLSLVALSSLLTPTVAPGVCPNCGQWQHGKTDGGPEDCLNECRRRGFAPLAPHFTADELKRVTCGRCGEGEAAGGAGLCATCNREADERGEA